MNEMTLEEKLLGEGFKLRGSFPESELSDEIRLLYFDETIRPVYVQIVQGKIARGNECKYPGAYLIYFKYEVLKTLYFFINYE